MLILIFIASICPCWAQQPGTKVEGNPTIAVKECNSRGCSFKDHKLVLDANWRWIHNEEFQTPGFASMIFDGNLFVNPPRLGNLLELCVSCFLVPKSAYPRNCYTGNLWDTSICPDPDTCAENCMVEGVDAGQYKTTYGVTAVPSRGDGKF